MQEVSKYSPTSGGSLQKRQIESRGDGAMVTLEHNIDDIESLAAPSSDKNIVLAAYRNKRICDLPVEYVKERLINILDRTVHASGFGRSTSEGDATLTYLAVISDVINEFKYLTIDEVELAFYYGSREKYGQYFGINVRTCFVWLTSYINITKPESVKKVFALLQPKQKGMSHEEKVAYHKMWVERVVEAYSKYIADNVFGYNDLGSILYKKLISARLIQIDGNEAERILAISRRVVTHVARKKFKAAKNMAERNELRTLLKSVSEEAQNGTTGNTNQAVNLKAREIVVALWFRKLKRAKTDCEEIRATLGAML